MNDRTSSMAQLSRWTDAMKVDGAKGAPVAESKPSGASLSGSKTVPMAKTTPDQQEPRKQPSTLEEEYEEEFEDYDEDFEEEGSPAKPSSKPIVASKPQPSLAPPKPLPASFVPTPAFDLKSIQGKDGDRGSPVSSLASLDAKKLQRERDDAVPKTARRNLENITSSLARSIADPRSMRVQRIMNSKVLDLHSEKFTQLTLLPSTPYEFYNNILRKPSAHIKQVGVPVDQEIREMEVNTEEVVMKDEVVQASFEDDTKFFKVLDDIRQRRRKGGGEHSMKNIADMDSLRNTAPPDTAIPGAGERGTSSLSSFLQRASGVIEGVLDSERSAKDTDNKATGNRSSQSSILDATVISFGTDKSKGENELIRMRATSFVRFSSVQTHLLLSVHPYPLEESENDLLPEKVCVCIF
ncbi:hypothetical protein EON65_19220 [archaeon]|nr:MAG: hypothetical protein EON65_19220 [archaeon]